MSDKSRETELLPCPFCGSADVSVDTKYQDRLNDGWGCTCLVDRCHGGIFVVDACYPTKEDAIKAWNTRANSHDALLEALEGLVRNSEMNCIQLPSSGGGLKPPTKEVYQFPRWFMKNIEDAIALARGTE